MAGYGAGLMCEYRHDDPEMNEKDPLMCIRIGACGKKEKKKARRNVKHFMNKKIKQPKNRLLCFN